MPALTAYAAALAEQRAIQAAQERGFDAYANDEGTARVEEAGVVGPETLRWLSGYRFSGDVWGYAEGETYFPYSPLMTVESTFAEAVLLETVLLSVYNHDSAIAAAASRMTPRRPMGRIFGARSTARP